MEYIATTRKAKWANCRAAASMPSSLQKKQNIKVRILGMPGPSGRKLDMLSAFVWMMDGVRDVKYTVLSL